MPNSNADQQTILNCNRLRSEKIRVCFRDKKLSVLSDAISKLEKDQLKLEKEIKKYL